MVCPSPRISRGLCQGSFNSFEERNQPCWQFQRGIGFKTCKNPDDVGAIFRFRPPYPLQIRKIKAIRESVFLRLILVIGMGSDIIGQLAPRSSFWCTEIIGKYRHHR